MSRVVLLNSGLNYATSAHDAGPLIAPVYFLPVYDYRLDEIIHSPAYPASEISAVADVSATSPFGELIYNISDSGYSLTDLNENWILSAGSASSADGGGGITIINDPVQSQEWQVNKYNDTLLSDYWNATSASFNESADTWSLIDASAVGGNNDPSLSGRDKFFRVVDYYPSSGDEGELKGTVKIRLSKNIGTVKFNKIAIYAIRYENGIDTGEDPVFFAEAYLKTLLVKSNNDGLNDITLDLQIGLQSLSATDYPDVFYSTSGDYWARVPEGLYYPERIGVGSFDGSVFPPQATIHTRRPRTIDISTDVPQIKADYDDDNYFELDVSSAGVTNMRFASTYGGPCGPATIEFDPVNYVIRPLVVGGLSLGSLSNNFDKGYFGSLLSLNYYDDNYIILDIINSAISATDKISLLFNELPGNVGGQYEQSSIVQGADITKLDRDLAVYTVYDDSATSSDRDTYIVAGVSADAFEISAYNPCSATNQNGLTHLNLINMIKASLISSDYSWLNSSSKIRMISRGGIDLYGDVTASDLFTASTISAISAGISNIGCVGLSATNINTSNTITTEFIDSLYDNTTNLTISYSPTAYTTLTTDSNGNLVIYPYSGRKILPNGSVDIGSTAPNKRWANIYANMMDAITVNTTNVYATGAILNHIIGCEDAYIEDLSTNHLHAISATFDNIGQWTELSASCSATLYNGDGHAEAASVNTTVIGKTIISQLFIWYYVNPGSADGVYITMPSEYTPVASVMECTIFGGGGMLPARSRIVIDKIYLNVMGAKITGTNFFSGTIIYQTS